MGFGIHQVVFNLEQSPEEKSDPNSIFSSADNFLSTIIIWFYYLGDHKIFHPNQVSFESERLCYQCQGSRQKPSHVLGTELRSQHSSLSLTSLLLRHLGRSKLCMAFHSIFVIWPMAIDPASFFFYSLTYILIWSHQNFMTLSCFT